MEECNHGKENQKENVVFRIIFRKNRRIGY